MVLVLAVPVLLTLFSSLCARLVPFTRIRERCCVRAAIALAIFAGDGPGSPAGAEVSSVLAGVVWWIAERGPAFLTSDSAPSLSVMLYPWFSCPPW